MTKTQTETRGMVVKEIQVIQQSRVVLEDGGLKTAKLEATLTKLLGDATAEDARQEFFKAQSQESTRRTNAAYDALYEAASGILDAILGVLGKNGVEAKVLQQIRSRIRMPGDRGDDASLPVEPAPAD